jgi:hypothetical protein
MSRNGDLMRKALKRIYWDSKRLPWLRFADDLPKFPEFPPVE